MTIQLAANGSIELTGTCTADDAEVLLQCCIEHPGGAVDWQDCDAVHAAVVQVLLVAGAVPIGTPRSAFLREHVSPLFLNIRETRQCR